MMLFFDHRRIICSLLVASLAVLLIHHDGATTDAFVVVPGTNENAFGTAAKIARSGGQPLYEQQQKSSPEPFFATMVTKDPPRTAATTATTDSKEQEEDGDTSATTTTPTQQPPLQQQQRRQERVLGSQENLMLPRQYGPNPDVKFPQMNHVSCAVVSKTPSIEALTAAVNDMMNAHPLLNARVEGDGEPTKRIDLFQMVREGDDNPCTFVSGGDDGNSVSASDVLTVVDVDGNDRESLDRSWQSTFQRDLDDGSWCDVEKGPLWKMELHRLVSSAGGANGGDSTAGGKSGSDLPCAIVLTFNHAVSDQSSANRMTDQLLRQVAEYEEEETNNSKKFNKAKPQTMPVALEDSVLGKNERFGDVQLGGFSPATVGYVAGKAAEGFKSPVILPDNGVKEEDKKSNALGSLSIIAGKTAGGQDADSDARKSVVQFRTLSKDVVDKIIEECRVNDVSVSNALTAAITLTATDFISGSKSNKGKKKERNYKVLQSLDMKRFGEQIDKGETVACMAGSMDLMHGPLPDGSGLAMRRDPSPDRLRKFWELARDGKKQTAKFVESGGPEQAVRVFDFAMTISDLNNLVYLTAQSKDTKGRAYSAGSTNVGVYERQEAFEFENDNGRREPLKTRHGRYEVEDVFFATTHIQSGCLYPVSCLTINGEMKFTFNPVSPIVDEETNEQFADALVDVLTAVATKEATVDASSGEGASSEETGGSLSQSLLGALPIASAVLGAAAVASHGDAYLQFFQSLAEMRQNVPDDSQFWPALNFWIFFAFGHPILPPILWISDVLHVSPGPKIAGLVPVTFVAANALVIGAMALSKEIRNAVNIALAAAFFAYVGAGLEGTAGLGDFNLALNDSYKGQVVKGCPAYEDVRQPSMDNFNLEKYQGMWYEQKFHDWTQFKEVYDTTLDIKLTEDGKGWVDDFAVKGPAPDAAKMSWDKSPVANGAHYFLFGRVDEKDPPGVLRESGFGVEFPNYIVDVQKDPLTGEYTEAIQFQCLQRGGVRVFEGINFLSRNPTMTEEQMAAMHSRAEKAGMFPYGASPEQMHKVARKLDDAPIDNNWQAMWRAIGFDKLLELLAESIEDGGRS